jgi:glycosyltransferase involved in cell wall biosynthesis
LRILEVADVSPLAVVGGGERVLWETASRLAARHRVTVLARAPAGAGPSVVERDGVRVRHFAADRRSAPAFALGAILAARRAATEELEREPPDVLHCHQPLSGYGVLRSAAGRRVPSLYTFHSPAPLEYRSRRGMTGLHRRGLTGGAGMALLWVLERACLRAASRVHVLSEFSAGLCHRLYRVPPERLVRVPGGADVERFQPAADRGATRAALGLPAAGAVLLTVRNLEARMGLDDLLRAIGELAPRWPDLLLLIGGTGSQRAALEALAAGLGLGGRVRFLGFVAEADLPRYYQAADAFVLPTRELEGFGLVAAEALACGTPVLATPVGAIPEVLAGLPADLIFEGAGAGPIARGLTRHLERLGREPESVAALRRRCREHAVARFAWSAVVPRLEAELAALAAGPGAAVETGAARW